MELSRFTLRVHPVILKKLKIIADTNGRSVNKEIEQIAVDLFEKENLQQYCSQKIKKNIEIMDIHEY